MSVHVQCTALYDSRATFKTRCGDYVSRPGLAFLRDNTQILWMSDLEFCIWDIKTMSCLFNFDTVAANMDTVPIIPDICRPEQDHIVMIKTRDSRSSFAICRISASITGESFISPRFTAIESVDGQLRFLEVRDDSLWEFDRCTERPLCWLPIQWRVAFDRGLVTWCEPLLVFGLQGGEIGVLNIESLRWDCTSIRRARAQ